MARKKKSARGRLRRWSATELKLLRQQAGKKSRKQIARVLNRTESAVAYKAHVLRISLDMR